MEGGKQFEVKLNEKYHKGKHFVKHVYLDLTITVEWSEPFDGPWTQKEDTITVKHNYNFID